MGVEENARQLYDVIGNPWKTSEYSQIDPPGYAKRKGEGAAYAIGDPRQGYTLNLTKSRIGLSQSITWEIKIACLLHWKQCIKNLLNCGKLLMA